MQDTESKALKTSEFVPWTETKVNDATANDITNYINERIAEYEASLRHLSRKLHSTKNLRNFLRKRNVFIQNSRGQSIPTALVSAASDQCCSMPDNMINEVVEMYRPVNKLPVSRDLKVSQNYLASFNNPIVTLIKAYKEEQKYAGMPSESFNLKFKNFTGFCNTIDIPINQRNSAFKVMLKDAALQHYYTIFNSEFLPDLSTMYQAIKLNFEGKEYQQSILVKWNELSLKTILQDTGSTDVEAALNSLITNLRHIQLSLSPEFRSDKILFAKLLQACRGHPSCFIACSTVADETVATLINRLRSNIATWKTQ
ncbi:hypothetical protein Golomagni_01720 [Golovinomyces magnicellulatus]|nr:hypothetical protein Golomagni_01720 [Golovinomyces magnicellulatus]